MPDAPKSTDMAADTGIDTAAALSGLQDQVDDLTATLESHQRLFERLRSAGLLPPDDDGRPR